MTRWRKGQKSSKTLSIAWAISSKILPNIFSCFHPKLGWFNFSRPGEEISRPHHFFPLSLLPTKHTYYPFSLFYVLSTLFSTQPNIPLVLSCLHEKDKLKSAIPTLSLKSSLECVTYLLGKHHLSTFSSYSLDSQSSSFDVVRTENAFNLLFKIGLFGAWHVDTPIFSTSKIDDKQGDLFPNVRQYWRLGSWFILSLLILILLIQ